MNGVIYFLVRIVQSQIMPFTCYFVFRKSKDEIMKYQVSFKNELERFLEQRVTTFRDESDISDYSSLQDKSEMHSKLIDYNED